MVKYFKCTTQGAIKGVGIQCFTVNKIYELRNGNIYDDDKYAWKFNEASEIGKDFIEVVYLQIPFKEKCGFLKKKIRTRYKTYCVDCIDKESLRKINIVKNQIHKINNDYGKHSNLDFNREKTNYILFSLHEFLETAKKSDGDILSYRNKHLLQGRLYSFSLYLQRVIEELEFMKNKGIEMADIENRAKIEDVCANQDALIECWKRDLKLMSAEKLYESKEEVEAKENNSQATKGNTTLSEQEKQEISEKVNSPDFDFDKEYGYLFSNFN